MKISVTVLTLLISAAFSPSAASAQQREDRPQKHMSQSTSKPEKCKTVISKAQDRFGRQVSVKKKVCR